MSTRLKTFNIPFEDAFIHIPSDLEPAKQHAWSNWSGRSSELVPPGNPENHLIDEDDRLDLGGTMSIAELFDDVNEYEAEIAKDAASSSRAAGHAVADVLGYEDFDKDEAARRIAELLATVSLRRSAAEKLKEQALIKSRAVRDKWGYLSAAEQRHINMPLISLRSSMIPVLPLPPAIKTKLEEQAQHAKRAAMLAADEKKTAEKKKTAEPIAHLALTEKEQQAMTMTAVRTVRLYVELGGPEMIRQYLQELQAACEELSDVRLSKASLFCTDFQQTLARGLDSHLGQSGEMGVEANFLPTRNLVRSTVSHLPIPRRSIICYPQNIVGQDFSIDHYIARPQPPELQQSRKVLGLDVLGVLDMKSPQAFKLKSLIKFLRRLLAMALAGKEQYLVMEHDGEKWKNVWAHPAAEMTQVIADEILQVTEAALVAGCTRGCLSALQHFVALDISSLDTGEGRVTVQLSPALDGANPIMSFSQYLLATALSPSAQERRTARRVQKVNAKLKKGFQWDEARM